MQFQVFCFFFFDCTVLSGWRSSELCETGACWCWEHLLCFCSLSESPASANNAWLWANANPAHKPILSPIVICSSRKKEGRERETSKIPFCVTPIYLAFGPISCRAWSCHFHLITTCRVCTPKQGHQPFKWMAASKYFRVGGLVYALYVISLSVWRRLLLIVSMLTQSCQRKLGMVGHPSS